MEETQKKKRNKFHLFKHHLHDENNDIEFRGPLSYRHLRIIAWVFMMFMAMSVVFSVFVKFPLFSKPDDVKNAYRITSDVFSWIGTLALPVFLIANFSVIMRSHKNYKKILMLHGFTALGLMAVAYLIVFRYYFTLSMRFVGLEYVDSKDVIETLLNINPSKFVYLNVFIDLFLCSLTYTFLTYEPKKYFQGKKIVFFRLLVLIPILYELGSIYVKLHALSTPEFMIPWYVFPLLTTKPPLLLLAFFLLVLISALRKKRYLMNGHTEDEYDRYLKTNANSLSFSIITCIVLFIAIILDIIIASICSVSIATKMGIDVETGVDIVMKSGLGKTITVIFIFPLIILFSYSRDYQDNLIDKIIPLVGIGVCVYSVVETFVQLLAA